MFWSCMTGSLDADHSIRDGDDSRRYNRRPTRAIARRRERRERLSRGRAIAIWWCSTRALPPPGGGRSTAFAKRRRSGGGDSRTANSVPAAFTPPRLATLESRRFASAVFNHAGRRPAAPPHPGEGGAEYAARSYAIAL